METENLNCIFDDIESCECTGEFVDEYVYDLEMADDTHTFIANDILVHNSLYCCYGDLFETFTEDTVPKTDKDKLEWILRFNKEFLDKWNNEQLSARFNPRHGHNIHEFELETVAKSGIFLAKKKYTQSIVFSKGNYYLEKPKVKGKGVELIKSQTPALARKILKELVDVLLNQYDSKNQKQFTLKFGALLMKYKKEWMEAPVEEISFSANIGKYAENVKNYWELATLTKTSVSEDGSESYKFTLSNLPKRWQIVEIPSNLQPEQAWYVKSSAGIATKGIAKYNYMAEQRGESNLMVMSGKVKYYYISSDINNSSVFSFPAGELPEWAPQPARTHQFQKCIIDPINRFCQAIGMQPMNSQCCISYNLFD